MTGNGADAGSSGVGSLTVSSLRQRNTALALRQIIISGQTTRANLARDCNLSIASVTNIVNDLMAEALVVETGSVASRGGRPITLLEPKPEGSFFIGADVGERGVAVELFDLRMRMVDREFRGGRAEEEPDAIARDLDDAVRILSERNPEAMARLVGIGLALPGVVETADDGEQTLYAQSLGWPPVGVRRLIDRDLTVFAENGAKTMARAEMWFGAARGADHAVVALLGRGVGLGVISDGVLQGGTMSSAYEWGHTKIERNGRACRCGGIGCVEAYLGADAILAAWAEAGGQFEGSGWGAIGRLLDAEEQGDPAALAVVADVLDSLGAALGGLVNLLNPQRVIVGGWVGLRLMESLAPRIEQAVRAASLERAGSQFELLTSAFGGDSVALGAALLPLEALISQPRAVLDLTQTRLG
jgi:predicted NBD/HSP70 family sugar kinase